jgi:hypothetical protein
LHKLEKLELVKLQNEILENSEKDGTPIEMATLEEIQTVIKKLKTGKSLLYSRMKLFE